MLNILMNNHHFNLSLFLDFSILTFFQSNFSAITNVFLKTKNFSSVNLSKIIKRLGGLCSMEKFIWIQLKKQLFFLRNPIIENHFFQRIKLLWIFQLIWKNLDLNENDITLKTFQKVFSDLLFLSYQKKEKLRRLHCYKEFMKKRKVNLFGTEDKRPNIYQWKIVKRLIGIG